MYIHSKPGWPALTWEADTIEALLADLRARQGYLLGRMSQLDFELREEASLEVLTVEITDSSAIEGELVDQEKVRSSD